MVEKVCPALQVRRNSGDNACTAMIGVLRFSTGHSALLTICLVRGILCALTSRIARIGQRVDNELACLLELFK